MNTGAGTDASGKPAPSRQRNGAGMADPPTQTPDQAPAKSPERGDWSDLGARVVSAIILAGLGLAAAWAGGPWLAAAAGAAVVAMSYEWARMSEPDALYPAFTFALAGALGAVMIASWGRLDLAMAGLAACALVSALRRKRPIAFLETAGGAIYVGAPAAIFLWLRDRAPEGLETILSLFLIIWSSDVLAYFGGKLIGGPRVAEGLSPRKTWSGIACGALAGGAAGLACAEMFAPGPHLRPIWIAIGLIIGFTGLMGDLFESFLKRRFGVKDASRFIPGHGGVLDRIDGLMAATLLTGAVLAFNPGLTDYLLGSGR